MQFPRRDSGRSETQREEGFNQLEGSLSVGVCGLKNQAEKFSLCCVHCQSETHLIIQELTEGN